MKNKKLGIILGALGGLLAVGLIVFAVISNFGSKNNELDPGTEITGPGYIMLSAEKSNVTIKAPGEYTLTGENKNNSSIIVDSEGVTLVLKDAKINTGKNAGIINLSESVLTIVVADGSTNEVFGGNENGYNAPIYSRGDIIIGRENGTLTIGNRKNKGPMVLTEEGKKVTIASGTIVGLNISDWAKDFTSYQKTLAVDLNQKIKRGEEIMVANDESGDVVFQTKASADFERIMVNAKNLKEGKYTLSSGGREIVSGVID